MSFLIIDCHYVLTFSFFLFGLNRNEDDANSKHEDAEDVDEDGMATKDSDSKAEMDRPCSSGMLSNNDNGNLANCMNYSETFAR